MVFKRKLVSLLLILSFVVMLLPYVTEEVNAAGQNDLVKHAKSHIGDMYNNFDDREKFTTDWCALFIVHCSLKAGLGKVIPTSDNFADALNLPQEIVRKGGKITYVNYNAFKRAKEKKYFSQRIDYDSKYKPKQGDILIVGNTRGAYGHVAIVRDDSGSTYSVNTYEGNINGTVNAERSDYYKYSRVGALTPRNSDPTYYFTAYVSPAYGNVCSHEATNKVTGKCTKCGAEYITYDKPDTSVTTSYEAKRFYKIKAETYLKKYPSSSAQNKSSAKLPVGKHIKVVGTLSNGTWYKIKYGGESKYVGYVPKSAVQKYTPGSDSTIQFSNLKENYTVVHGGDPGMATAVSSNYPIRYIKVKIGTKEYTRTFKELYLSRNLNLKKSTDVDFSKFASGTYNYKFTATDISGKAVTATGKFLVYDSDIKKPTIDVKNTNEGKTVTIKSSVSGGTLHYYVNGKAASPTSNTNIPLKISKAGTYEYKAFVWTKDKKRSFNTVKKVTVSQVTPPVVSVEQDGKDGYMTIKPSKSGSSIKYKINSGTTKTYDGKTISVADGDVITAYAYQSGYIKSDVTTYTAEFAEPSVPKVTLSNADGRIAAGKTATVVWNKDKRADSYTVRLYRSSDDVLIEEKETKSNTESFTIKEAGEYCIRVTASNELGDSDPSEKAAVTVVAPLTVTFQDGKGKEAKILMQVTIDYGDVLNEVTAPAKKGYTFTGWEDLATGEISKSAYHKDAVKETKVYAASYEKKTYEVKIYDTAGKLIEKQTVAYGEGIDTNTLMDSVNRSLKEGYVFAGWSVTHTASGESMADYTNVDSDMEVQAVAKWANQDFPVNLEITSASQSDNGRYIDTTVKLATEKNADLQMYLVVALKAKDSETGIEKTVYTDRKIVYLDAGYDNESEKNVTMKLNPGQEVAVDQISTVEAVALQCKEDMSTGGLYSESKSFAIPISKTWGPEQEPWTTEKPSDMNGTRQICEKTQYRYQDTKTAYSGKSTMKGYTVQGDETVSVSVGNWTSTAPAEGTEVLDDYKIVKENDSYDAGRWYAYYCDCKKTAWKNNSKECSYCHGKTKNTLVIYGEPDIKANYSSANGSYFFKTKLTSSADGKIRLIYWNGKRASSFQTNSTTLAYDGSAHIYLWRSTTFDRKIYRSKVTKKRNIFTQTSDFTEWSDTMPPKTSEKNVERRTETRKVYSYRELMENTAKSVTLNTDGMYRSKPGSRIDSAENLSKKQASILVYQANNTDPNKYQLQYLGHTEIGENNSYEFSFIPREKPTTESGNYIVALAVEGTTGLFKVDTIEAPKAEHKVTVEYKDASGQDLSVVKTVKDHEDLDMSDITTPDIKGYYFGGWSGRTTDIREDGVVRAQYRPILNSVVFVDWINQNVIVENAKTGTMIRLPGAIEDVEGYNFTGWKLEDGTVLDPAKAPEVKVTGNMVITAQFTPVEYTVTFHGADGKTISTQKVKYGEAAEPPAYEPPEGSGTFAGWSTSDDWWSVERDVDIYPIMTFEEVAQKPEARTYVDEDTDAIKLELSSEEEDAKIYYTTEGAVPDAESITEYQNTAAIDYQGGLHEYSEPVSFEEETQVIAVAAVDGKNESAPLIVYYDPDSKNIDEVELEDGWKEVGSFHIKAQAGKDITVEANLSENPGLTGCDFLVDYNSDIFYADRDVYDDPICTKGPAFENGTTFVSNNESGTRITGVSTEENTATGNVFKLTLHVEDDAEEGVYPIGVYYMPKNTLDKDFYETELPGLSAKVTSQASIDLNTLDIKLARTSYTYEGKAIEPAVNIEGLKENEDYTVNYENNTDAGTGKVIIQGTGAYEGSVEKTFTITPANISDTDVKAIETQEYTGKAIEPEVQLTLGEKALEKDKDYTVSYADNTEAGTAKAVISGKGNFKGSRTEEFTIEKSAKTQIEELQKSLEDANAQIKDLKEEKAALEKEMTDAKKKQSDAEAAAEQARAAKEAAEKELASANTDKAAAQAKLDAANADLAKAEKELSDAKKEAANAEQKLADMTKAKEDAEKRAQEAEKKLEELQGGDKNDTEFTRYAGSSRYQTSRLSADGLKKLLGISKFENIIVASGENYPDALAGSYLAKVKDSPILLVTGSEEKTTVSYIKSNLKTGGKVYLLGGTGAVSADFEKNLKGNSITVKRLAGSNRYDTNLSILKESGVTNEDLLICSGGGYADSLSASAAGKPILLVDSDLSAQQEKYLGILKSKKVYLIGGTGAVSRAVEKELNGYTVKRFAGSDRFETSTMVAKAFFPSSRNVVLAYGYNFPDGLSGGPLAIAAQGPLILTSNDGSSVQQAKTYTKSAGVTQAFILGGQSLISDDSVKRILN